MKKKMNIIDRFREDPDANRLFVQERTIIELTELICREMSKQNVSRGELAGRIGKSKSQVTQMLSGSRNLTIRSLSDILCALDLALDPVVREVNEAPGKFRKLNTGNNISWQNSGTIKAGQNDVVGRIGFRSGELAG